MLLLAFACYSNTIRYVNSQSTVGGDGTTNSLSGSTRAYKHIQNAIDAAPATLANVYEIVVYGMDTLSSNSLTIPNKGSTSNNYFYIHSPNDPAYRHNGTYDQTKSGVFSTMGWGRCVYINSGCAKIVGLVISGTDGYSSGINCDVSGNGTSILIDECVIKNVGSANGVSVNGNNASVDVRNCIILNGNVGVDINGGSVSLYNLTIVGATTAINRGWCYQLFFSNILFYNNGTDISGVTESTNPNQYVSGPYCSTNKSIASSGLLNVGVGNRFSQTFNFVNSGAGDYHLASNDAGALNHGTNSILDLSTRSSQWDGSGMLNLLMSSIQTNPDIDAEERTGTWDIGADEYIFPCDNPMISSIKIIDTIGESGFYDHSLSGGTTDSVTLFGTWPDSTYIKKTGSNIGRITYRWKQKQSNNTFKTVANGCSKYYGFDTVTILGPSVNYLSSPYRATQGIEFSQYVQSAWLADSFTVDSLPTGVSIIKTGINMGTITGTPSVLKSKRGYAVYVWKNGIKADSTFDTISVIAQISNTIRYVNSESTVGGNGTTNEITGSTRAYKHIQNAIDAAPSTLTGTYTIYVQGMDTVSSNSLTINDHGTTVDNYFIIKNINDPDYRHEGKFDPTRSGVFSNMTWGKVIDIACPYVRIEGLVVYGIPSMAACISASTSTSGNVLINSCLIQNTNTSNGFSINGDNTVLKVTNCITYGGKYGVEINGGTFYSYNNTFANVDTGATRVWSTSAIFKNTLFYGTDKDINGSGITNTYCATDKNTSSSGLNTSGEGNRFGQYFKFINSSSNDFHLLLSDTSARGRASDLRYDAVLPVTDDIDGQIRGIPIDIGADQYFTPCNFPTISGNVLTDTLGNTGYFDHAIGGGSADSVLQVKTWPDSTWTEKIGSNMGRTHYWWRKKFSKSGFTVKVFGCSNTQAKDSITVIGPSISYTANPKICRVGVPMLQGVSSINMADSATAPVLPNGLSIIKTGVDMGRVYGTPLNQISRSTYKVFVWRKNVKADSTFDTLTILPYKAHECSVYVEMIPQDTGLFPTVQVGQSVLFNAENTLNVGTDTTGTRWEWDFGDGFYLKYGSPLPSTEYSGINVLHYFMKPGIFDVKCYYMRMPDSLLDTVVRSIIVTGKKPIDSFEVYKAPSQSRVRQFLYTRIPLSKVKYSDSLIISIKNNTGYSNILKRRSGLNKIEDTTLLNNSELPAGDFTTTHLLKNITNDTISIWNDFFSKNYAGYPKYGIDEYNNFTYFGSSYFPVSTWLTSISEMELFKTFSNQIKGEGYNEMIYNKESWKASLAGTRQYGITASGPFRQNFKGVGFKDLRTGYIHRSMAPYLTDTAILNNRSFYSWFWEDEANIGGRTDRFPAAVFKAWTWYTSKMDNERPSSTNVYGYDYISYKPEDSEYDYLISDTAYGGKKDFWTDVSGMDIYPIDKANHSTLKGRFIMYTYLAAIDSMKSKNRSLIPFTSFIEMMDIDDPTTRPPTMREMNMEVWMNVIHGIKGIDWFNYFGGLEDTMIAQAKTTYNQLVKYQTILATPTSKIGVITNRASVGGRVDAMIRDNRNKDILYVFAIRVTEPDSIPGNSCFLNASEPTNLSTTLTLDTSLSGTVTVEGESRTLNINNGVFTDNFSKNALHIYSINRVQTPLPKNIINIINTITRRRR